MSYHTVVAIFEHWRSRKDTTQTAYCVRSIREQAGVDGILPIVIQNNHQSSFDYQLQRKVLAIRLLRPTTVAGFVREAHEVLMAEAPEASFLFPINNDVVFDTKDAILTLVEELSDPKVGIVAPGTSDKGAGWLYTESSQRGVSLIVPHVDNHCWGMRVDIFEKIGYPSQVGHWADWYSNIDFCYRARQAGFLVKAVLGARVIHSGGSFGEANPEGSAEGWAWFCQRYPELEERKKALGEL